MATPRMPLLSGVSVLILECERKEWEKSEKQSEGGGNREKEENDLARSLPFSGEPNDVEGAPDIHGEDLWLEEEKKKEKKKNEKQPVLVYSLFAISV
jgi:hypothetical protein